VEFVGGVRREECQQDRLRQDTGCHVAIRMGRQTQRIRAGESELPAPQELAIERSV
jgi:hypothetical protein